MTCKPAVQAYVMGVCNQNDISLFEVIGAKKGEIRFVKQRNLSDVVVRR
jgi:hypothetical protein